MEHIEYGGGDVLRQQIIHGAVLAKLRTFDLNRAVHAIKSI